MNTNWFEDLFIEEAKAAIENRGNSSGDSSGGVTSWNDLQDKPFGESGTNTVIEPDFNAFAEVTGLIGNYEFVKVSNVLPTIEQITSANVTWHCDDCGDSGVSGFVIDIQEDNLISLGLTDGCECAELSLYIVYNDNVSGEFYTGVTYEFPECGIYAESNASVLVDKIAMPTVVKTIDSKYIPKAAHVSNVTEAPTAEDFNALLTSLRNAGYMN